jgi:hypothetical protein
MPTVTKRPTSKPSRRPSKIVWALIGLAVIIGVVVAIVLLQHKPSRPAGNVKELKPSSGSSSAGATPTNNNTSSKDQNPAGSTAQPSSTPPRAPSGNFVSNHKAGPLAQELSLCTTTPGATCSITFTNGSTTKTLEKKQTDNSGGAFWNWTPQSLGLAAGSWQVTAAATLNNQSVTTPDPKPLEITS